MKLVDFIKLIPENVPFIVEETVDNDEVGCAWWIYDEDERVELIPAYHEEVISVRPEYDTHYGNTIVVEVRYSPKPEET